MIVNTAISFEALDDLLISESIGFSQSESHVDKTYYTVYPEKDKHWERVAFVETRDQGGDQHA